MAKRLRLTKYGRLVAVLTVLVLVIIVLGTILGVRSCSSSSGGVVDVGEFSDSTMVVGSFVGSVDASVDVDVVGSVGKVWHNYLEELLFDSGHQSLYGISVVDYDIVHSEIAGGETFSRLLNDKFGVNIAIVNELITKCGGVFDLRDLRAGKPYTAFLRRDSLGVEYLDYLVYEQTQAQYIVFGTGSDICVRQGSKRVITEERYSEGVIESSLYATIYKEGLSPTLAHKLSEIYKWSIDFFGIQKGDKFRVLYEERFIDTLSVGVGTIYGAEFTHMGKPYMAIRFEQGDELGYWDTGGKNLRKNFLSAPLSFSARVSSKFGMRIHPIKRVRRQHNGVDYAAPSGTPILAIADGTVTRRYWDRYGGGNTMWIKHAQGLESGYLHLRGYAKGISPGVRVRQGQVIGYVGSTGMSTGPHLDFRIKERGRYINPQNVPATPTTPIKAPNRVAFDRMLDDVVSVMDSYAR